MTILYNVMGYLFLLFCNHEKSPILLFYYLCGIVVTTPEKCFIQFTYYLWFT